MRIRSVRFLNLNSLQGPQFIDFAQGPLAGAGLFAITGPTGAGKSTILDAITLALFGRASRYQSKPSPPDMISRGKGEASAEVVFTAKENQTYRASWYIARARKKVDGALQAAKRFIFDENGKEIASGARPCDELIVSLTGLTPDRFFRSAMLAQGEFAKFLQADERERADLLESLTNTEIYSRISSACYRRYDQAKYQIESIRNQLNSIQILDEVALQELSLSIEDHQQRLVLLRNAIAIKQLCVNAIVKKQKYLREVDELKSHFNQYRNMEETFRPKSEQLRLHKTATSFLKDLQTIKLYQSQLLEAEHSVKHAVDSKESHEATASESIRTVLQWTHAQSERYSAQLSELHDAKFSLEYQRNALELWLQVHESTVALIEQLPTLQSTANHLLLLSSDLNNVASNLKGKEEELAKLQSRRPLVTQELQSLIDQQQLLEQGIQSRQKQYAILLPSGHAQELLQTSSAIEVRLERLRDLKELLSSRETLTVETGSLEDDLQRLKLQVASAESDLLQQQKCCELADRTQQALMISWIQASKLKSLESHRQELQKDQPCPLCGALEHPFAIDGHPMPSESELEAKLSQAKQEFQALAEEVRVAIQNLNSERTKLAVAENSKNQKTSELLRLSAEIDEFASSLGLPNHDLAEFQSKTSECEQELAKLASTKSALDALVKADENDRQSIDLLAVKIDGKNEQVSQLESNVAEHQSKCQDFAEQFQQLQGKITSESEEFQRLSSRWCPMNLQQATPVAIMEELNSIASEYRSKQGEYQKFIQLISEVDNDSQKLQRKIEEFPSIVSDCQSYLEELRAALEGKRSTNEVNSSSHAYQLIESAMNAWRVARTELELANKTRKDLASSLEQAERALEQKLVGTAFKNRQALEAAILADHDLATLESEQRTIVQQLTECTTLIDSLEQDLKILEAENPNLPTDLEPEAEKLAELESERETWAKNLGMLEQKLIQDSENRKRYATEAKEQLNLAKSAETQRILSDLIGSADGKKFRTYTQGLMLNYLIAHANKHLRRFSDRYELVRGLEGELQMDVCDLHQANVRRPIASLSGGESFLVSLALALGLSDLSGANVQIDTLFIDEGFGTLDGASLDLAIAALETLRGENKTIGVISHVETLKERISTQIRVHKRRNGVSEIEIVG